jgi:predicted Zn-dependent peptidase
MRVVGEELARLREQPATEDELERARENVKGRTTLSMESTLARMNRLGSSLLMDIPILTLDEVLGELDAVTLEDVGELARRLFAPTRLSAAAIGPDEHAFRKALEAVDPELAAAA